MATVMDRPKIIGSLSEATVRPAMKSDWEELGDLCFAAAQRKGLTDKDIKEAIKRARSTADDCSR